MDDVFAQSLGAHDLRVTQIYHQDRNQVDSGTEVAHKQLVEYNKLLAASERVAKIVSKMSEACGTTHSTFIHLSGFREQEKADVETIMMVCKLNQWQHARWCSSNEYRGIQHISQYSHAELCQRLQLCYKRKRKFRIQISADGMWQELTFLKGDNNLNRASQPQATLQDVLIVDRSHRNTPPSVEYISRRRERLDLGVKVVRSLLCLAGGPLLKSRWKSEKIFAAKDADSLRGERPPTKAYVHNDDWTDAPTSVGLRELSLDLGLLLWEVLFRNKIVPKDEDFEEDDDDATMYNALLRQMREDEEKDEEPRPADDLGIILACLDAFDYPDSKTEMQLRLFVYEKILKPLMGSLQSYDTPRLDREATSHIPQLRNQNNQLPSDMSSHPFTQVPGMYGPVRSQNVTSYASENGEFRDNPHIEMRSL